MQITKILSGSITAEENGKFYKCSIRGNLRRDIKISVGDYVDFEFNPHKEGSIIVKGVKPRENCLVRPYVSNVDILIIVVTIKPMPDFGLVDALLINCEQMGIMPIIVISKYDTIKGDFYECVQFQYGKVCEHIIPVSAQTGFNIDKLQELLKGKLSVLAGQSGVGKSTLINALLGLNQEVGELGEKICRGRHTTRLNEIFVSDSDVRIADTPGFSRLEVTKVTPDQLKDYYLDFHPYNEKCAFKDCSHINVDPRMCGVIQALKSGKIDASRYLRYTDIYFKLKEKWEKRYD